MIPIRFAQLAKEAGREGREDRKGKQKKILLEETPATSPVRLELAEGHSG